MKKNIVKNQKLIVDFAVGLIISVAFLASVSAQNKVITREEFETVRSKAATKLKQISYRSVTSQKIGKTELPTIYEFVPPNREHFITTTKSPEYLSEKLKTASLGVNKYEEWIYIGEKIYFRNALNKKWEKSLPGRFGGNGDGQGKGSGIGDGQADRTFSAEPNKTIEYQLTPNQFIDRQ